MIPREYIVLMWVCYLSSAAGAVLCYVIDWKLAYGAFSWCGGALFTALWVAYAEIRWSKQARLGPPKRESRTSGTG